MNRAVGPSLMLIPDEMMGQILALLLMLGGVFMVVGAKRISAGLITTAITLPFLSMIIETFLNDLFAAIPAQQVQLVAWLVQGLLYLMIFGGIMGLLFGQSVWNQAKGHILAEAIIGIFKLIFNWKFIIAVIALSILFLWRSG